MTSSAENINSINDGFSNIGKISNNYIISSTDEYIRKSQNMTECVPVPSSEHVAEIVGRQGCKIKALRAKTNTYIKTPVRGEEPVFVVTGRKEDVSKARTEILSAADHFSLIRASRKSSEDLLSNSFYVKSNGRVSQNPQMLPGQITIYVKVPYRVVGLVVGPKGATIKNIQQETQTYIVTPSRERDPIFEITGLPENVQSARKQIESHIAMRTGSVANKESDTISKKNSKTFSSDKVKVCEDLLLNLCKSGISSAFNIMESHDLDHNFKSSNVLNNRRIMSSKNSEIPLEEIHLSVGNSAPYDDTKLKNINNKQNMYNYTDLHNVGENRGEKLNKADMCLKLSDCNNLANKSNSLNSMFSNTFNNSFSSASSTTSCRSAGKGSECKNMIKTHNQEQVLNDWQNLKNSLELNGVDDNQSKWTSISNELNTNESHPSPTASISPADSLLGELSLPTCNYIPRTVSRVSDSSHFYTVKKKNRIPLASQNEKKNLTFSFFKSDPPFTATTQRECLLCHRKSVSAALVPCGHNVCCIDCANQICSSLDASCPICSLTVYQAIHILV